VHWLDRLSLRVLQRMQIFEGGWGDVEQFRARAAEGNSVRAASRLEFTWSAPQRVRGLTVQDGVAVSPSAELLPSNIATVHVRRVLTPRPAKRRVVVPPSWGDGGYGMRMWLVGALVAQGLEPWLLEGAYLGARAAPMPKVEDFLRMGFAHIEEVRALLQTHTDEEVPTAVAGYSMAGQLGSHAVATLPFEVPVVAMAAPTSADVVFIEGPLSKQVKWEALGDDAREKMREVLQHANLLKLEVPRSAKRAVAFNAGDGIVAPAATQQLAKHWGVEPMKLSTGHAGAYVFERRALQRFIADTLR
jgi:hypothetical protein